MGPSRLALLAALALAWSASSRAAGPLFVNGAGTPLVWHVNPIPYNPDRGTLGALDNPTAVALVAGRFAVWSGVTTADINFTNAGALPVDVTASNVNAYLGVCGDGLSPIIFDTDGTITDAYFGQGASNNVLGFASPDCIDYATADVREGVAVLNGKWVDGISTAANPELPLATFGAVFVHEFGHYVNLDHSQINVLEAFDGDPDNNDSVATMFPILVGGAEAATPALDDRVAISTLYPAPSFFSGYAKITGTIRRSDGTTPFQGAYVVARRLDDPRFQAVGTVSGARYFPGFPGGSAPASLQGLFELPGLPPGTYSVEIEPVDSRFTGGSGVGPLDPPAALPGYPEFYNGANEAATNPPDDPAAAVGVSVAAGQTVTGVDVVINALIPPSNDACSAAKPIPTLPWSDSIDTRAATTAGTDPVQSCPYGGPNVDSASVWYALTANRDMTVVADTLGSDYDTVLTAHTGSCNALAEIGCNDDVSVAYDSRLSFSVRTGETVLIEVAGYDTTGGGQLEFHVAAGIACNAAPRTGCSAGSGGRLRVLNDPFSDRALLRWRWRGGPGGGSLGDPTVATDYALCLYDEHAGTPGLRVTATAPAGESCDGRPCWSASTWGFRYTNRDPASGLERIVLRENSAGVAGITIRGAGAELGLPLLPLAQDPGVTIQLVNGAGSCWETRYLAPASRNSGTQFTDKPE